MDPDCHSTGTGIVESSGTTPIQVELSQHHAVTTNYMCMYISTVSLLSHVLAQFSQRVAVHEWFIDSGQTYWTSFNIVITAVEYAAFCGISQWCVQLPDEFEG